MKRFAILLLTVLLLALGLQLGGYGQTQKGPAVDEFYPQEEATERKAIVWPRVVELRAQVAVLREPNKPPREVRVGEKLGDFELVAVLRGGEPMAVLEQTFARWGVIGYIGKKRAVAVLRKAVGRLENLPMPGKGFPAEYYEQILSGQEDVLGQKVLASGKDPSYEAVAGLLPPLDAYTFLGTVTSQRKVAVTPDGRLGFAGTKRYTGLEEILFDPWKPDGMGTPVPADVKPGPRADLNPEADRVASKKGLVGGYLPVIDFAFYDPERRSGWEQVAYAVGDEPRVRMSIRSSDGKRKYWNLPARESGADGTEFYRDLLAVHREWEKFFAKGLQADVPEVRVRDVTRAGIVRAMISYVGLHPKYGAGGYWAKQHDTFPPTTLLFNSVLIDWGFTEEARDRLGYYLSKFVTPEGKFDYYGPAVTEYGQMLALAARYVRVAGDRSWLRTHLPALQRIGKRLLSERAGNRGRFPPDSPNHGLLYGAAEADTRKDEAFYYSGDTWCWRGFVELGQLMAEEAARAGDAVLLNEGQRWVADAAVYREDILKSMRRSLRTETKPPFLPPIAGMDRVFKRMTEDSLASYTNYRYWLEMLSPDFLPADLRDNILDFRNTHGGDMLATTRFSNHLDDWPYTHQAWGLLSSDRIQQYLLGFYGHLAHHLTPGTFTSYEQMAIRGGASRDYWADYCVPAQVVAPQMLRWMMVWEPWGGQELWLARAVPQRWFELGFAVAVPTRWGPVNLTVKPAARGFTATVQTSSPHPDMSLYLRLRPERQIASSQISVQGAKDWQWDLRLKALKVSGDWKQLTVIVR